MSSKTIGYICLWHIPQVSIQYTDIRQLAQDVGFDEDFIPQSPKRRYAWEKATNLGAVGMKLDAPGRKVSEVLRQFGAKPTVRLNTVIVSNSAPKLVRHIVRRVTIPTQQDAGGKRKLAERQLDQETVCIMEFDCGTESFRSTGQELGDTQHYVNGDLKGVVKDLHDKVSLAVDYADSNDIRRALREWFEDHNATRMGSGGAYFVPYTEGAFDNLKSTKAYLEALYQYQVDPAQKHPQLMIFPLSESGDTFETRLDVAHNAVEQFKANLQELVDELAPVIAGERTRNVSDKVRERCTLRFMELHQQISQYREVLDDQLSVLDVFLQSASSFIVSAQSVQTYKLTPVEQRALQEKSDAE
jgi:hypothetical protein